MKINYNDRKQIWDKYTELETQLRFVKGIVQNPIDITNDMLEEHFNITSKLIGSLKELHIMIKNKTTNINL